MLMTTLHTHTLSFSRVIFSRNSNFRFSTSEGMNDFVRKTQIKVDEMPEHYRCTLAQVPLIFRLRIQQSSFRICRYGKPEAARSFTQMSET